MSGWPSLDRADDERLARTLAAGDPSALIQVMDRYAARLYDYCHALLRDQDQAAGALHDALIAAYAHVSGLREPDRFRGWLYALVRNECMRRLRDPDRPAQRHEAPEVEDGFLDDAELARRQEARRLVHAALSGLRGRERESVDLMLRHGLDADEIGGVLGMDAQQAAGLTAEARARLDDSLAAAYIARAGRDDCFEAAAIVDDAGWPLPPPVVHRLVQHIESCGVCGPRRDRTVSAARLLQVLPVAMMPNDLRGLVMATATDPALAPDLAAVAHAARPFDDWGWPAMVEQEPVRAASSGGGGGQRGVWAALAAAAAVIAVVAAAYYLMSGSSGEPTAAQGPSDGTSASSVSPSSPTESQEPSDTPTPTRSAEDARAVALAPPDRDPYPAQDRTVVDRLLRHRGRGAGQLHHHRAGRRRDGHLVGHGRVRRTQRQRRRHAAQRPGRLRPRQRDLHPARRLRDGQLLQRGRAHRDADVPAGGRRRRRPAVQLIEG
ncbi:sigma-70 family RNA polymerase sigma factor [Actinomadura citrea]|uniref:sigma-70 family RNA polymerase sigma factor n=1 Tax=Actinomadura citrea TaxID=46158 RepID=UPI00167112A3|nr:sigma-70 family RNA polymerase sigma factor [Actinomadura citrea]GGT55647.1 hypothetical protein GCM10010177_09570 [Actinomadura citrea]